MHITKIISVVAALFLLAACGGSGGSSGILITGKKEISPNTTEGGETPLSETRTLQWPVDFPSDFVAGEAERMTVQGLPPQAAYNFRVSLSDGVSVDDNRIFIRNMDNANQSGNTVCVGNPDCTGTVTADQISIQFIGDYNGIATLEIEPSSAPPMINQGAIDSPVELIIGSDSEDYEGTVGSSSTVDNQLVRGKSFFRLTNLSIGDRYRIRLTEASDDVALALAGSEVNCIPAYSGTNDCLFTAAIGEIDFSVTGDVAPFGAGYTVNVDRVSSAASFEGNWHMPLSLRAMDGEVFYHTGGSDRYSSYYTIHGLDPNLRYRLLMTGNTTAAWLKLDTSLTDLSVVLPRCGAVDPGNESGEQYCIIQNTDRVDFAIESLSDDSRYLISLVPGAHNEGSTSSPLKLQLADSKLLHAASVNTDSHYLLQGLTVGTQYLLQLNAVASIPNYQVSSSDGEPIKCDSAGSSHCTFTAADSQVVLQVTDNNSVIGEHFNLSLLSTVASDATQPVPFDEALTLTVESLPHDGTVGDSFSDYTVTGLLADHYYLAEISGLSENTNMIVWPNTASGVHCDIVVRAQSTGCLSRAGSDGQLKIRVSGVDVGGQYRVDVKNAFDLQADYTSENVTLEIADNSIDGVSSSIEISDALTIEYTEVVLLIDHQFTDDLQIRLEAPDGQMIMLADHVPGSSFAGTVYSDKAPVRAPSKFENNSHAWRRYRPQEPLHVLNGTSIAGVWKLHVADDTDSNRADSQGGALLAWGLNFSSVSDVQAE